MKITNVDHRKLMELEESLWKSRTRFNREYMEQILAPDFFEFGRSGRIYNREETLKVPSEPINVVFPLKNFRTHYVDANVVLVTYISEVIYDQVEVANRSSLWLKTETGWKLKFHQGTAINPFQS